jgi:hypothetical protein
MTDLRAGTSGSSFGFCFSGASPASTCGSLPPIPSGRAEIPQGWARRLRAGDPGPNRRPLRSDRGRIVLQGATLASFRYEIAAFVILELAVVRGPLCVFASRLLALKRQGRREYGALAARCTRA